MSDGAEGYLTRFMAEHLRLMTSVRDSILNPQPPTVIKDESTGERVEPPAACKPIDIYALVNQQPKGLKIKDEATGEITDKSHVHRVMYRTKSEVKTVIKDD